MAFLILLALIIYINNKGLQQRQTVVEAHEALTQAIDNLKLDEYKEINMESLSLSVRDNKSSNAAKMEISVEMFH